jgi:hypothetical protein
MAEDDSRSTTWEVLGTASEPPAYSGLDSLRTAILARTGQDVRRCRSCAGCECLSFPGMDLSVGEMIRAAARDDLRALTCRTLWASEDLLFRPIPCSSGLALASIILALQDEAQLRGLAPSEVPSP